MSESTRDFKRLQVMTPDGWRWVFCRHMATNTPVLTNQKKQALPQRAQTAQDDLMYCATRMPRHWFRLAHELDSSNEHAVFYGDKPNHVSADVIDTRDTQTN